MYGEKKGKENVQARNNDVHCKNVHVINICNTNIDPQ